MGKLGERKDCGGIMKKSEYICDICGAKTTTDEINSGKTSSNKIYLILLNFSKINKPSPSMERGFFCVNFCKLRLKKARIA